MNNLKQKKELLKFLKDKIKNLRKDKIYDYSVFGEIVKENKKEFQKAILELVKDDIIVKIGNKKFYKRGARTYAIKKKPLHIKANPSDKKLLRSKYINKKYFEQRLTRNFFWSNPHGKVKKEVLIYKIIESQSLSNLNFARINFGDNEVKKVFLEHFDLNEYSFVAGLLNV